MFKEMRKQKREISQEEAKKILLEGEYGVLSTVGADNYSYGVPISYALVDDNIYLHCAMEGKKLDNIKFNQNVSFCVVGKTELVPKKFSTKYESAIAFGKAELAEGEDKEAGLKAFIEKYSPDYLESGMKYIQASGAKTIVVKIKIEHLTGKRSW